MISIGLVMIMYSRSITSHQTHVPTLLAGIALVILGVVFFGIGRRK